jgi:hypothetical protein
MHATRFSPIALLAAAGLITVLVVTATRAPGPTPADASFHLLRVDRVMADGDVQYVELRMTSPGQTVVNGKHICFYDGLGSLAASFLFSSDLNNGADEATVLIGTSAFDAAWAGGSPDFIMDPSIVQPAGRVTFAAACAGAPIDSVSYGTGYLGAVDNPPQFPDDLPADGRALRLDADAPDFPRVNADDYSLGVPDFKKNDGTQGNLDETASPTASPTPTAAPGQRTWGDDNCSGSADPIDSLLTLRFDAGLSTNTGDCPAMGDLVEVANASPHPWGDVDCGGDVNPVDSLKLLRFDAGLDVAQAAGCPEIGTAVSITA